MSGGEKKLVSLLQKVKRSNIILVKSKGQNKGGDGLGNLADMIEQFILRKLANEEGAIVVLRRNEIAEQIECAPSQVSYVLNTRFTSERGFMVESRRGSGGFVRIIRIPLQNIIYQNAANQISNETTLADIEYITERLRKYGLMTHRESTLVSHFYNLIDQAVGPAERTAIMRALLLSLAYI